MGCVFGLGFCYLILFALLLLVSPRGSIWLSLCAGGNQAEILFRIRLEGQDLELGPPFVR